MEDREIQCVDCSNSFLFTVRDQEFYKENEFDEPKRCRPCREKKKKRFEGRENREVKTHY